MSRLHHARRHSAVRPAPRHCVAVAEQGGTGYLASGDGVVRLRRQGGIALLEAMLAIVILGIGLLGTVGMQARAYSALSDAGMRAEATLATEKLIGVMSADVANIALYNLAENGSPNARMTPWVQETKAAIPGVLLAVTVQDQPALNRYQVDISVRWQRKARSDVNRHRVTSYIAR